jgi:peptidoglycan/LPS O-acetylase OafA/YrhL
MVESFRLYVTKTGSLWQTLNRNSYGVYIIHVIVIGIFGTLLSDLHHYVSIRRIGHQMAVIFVAGFLTASLSFLLTFLRAEPVVAGTAARLIWQPLYSAVLGPLFFLPTAWWMRMNRTRHRSSRGG